MPHLILEHLSIQYTKHTVIQDLSFSVENGESVAILGANGAGKTTLLLALVNMVPFKGTIKLDDVALTSKTVTQFRQRIGYVFQNPEDQLFCATIQDDIAFGLENQGKSTDDIQRCVTQWLDTFCLSEFANQSAHTLSGGEQRMAALATVLAMDPEIILLDEPTAFLDARSRKRLEKALESLKQTKIIATHDIFFAKRMCKRAIILNEGKIIADGLCDELFHDQNLMDTAGLDWL